MFLFLFFRGCRNDLLVYYDNFFVYNVVVLGLKVIV